LKHSTDGILTTHVGRLPNPPNQAAILQARDSGDQHKFEALTTAAIGDMIARQKAIGLDIMSDGEFWKVRDQQYYDDRVSGVRLRPLKPGEPPQIIYTQMENRMPEFSAFWKNYYFVGNTPVPGVLATQPTTRAVISGPVVTKAPDAVRHEVQVIKDAIEAAGESVDNFTFPVLGPGWLGHMLWNEYYKTDEEYVFAMADILKQDYQAVIAAGFHLQVDDPSMATRFGFLDPPLSIEDYKRHYQVRIDALNHAIGGLPQERILYHVCWGSWHTPHATDLPFEHIIEMLLQVNAGAYSVEAADVRHELDWQLWQKYKLPEGKVYVPGVVAHKTTTIEPPELVAHRIERYAKLMGRENVVASLDCGVGGRCYPDVGWAKLKTLVEGARLATRTLWGAHTDGVVVQAAAV
jgi:5-methyltetrahydropteroyltriglutamate--homocysteine methyltransferase